MEIALHYLAIIITYIFSSARGKRYFFEVFFTRELTQIKCNPGGCLEGVKKVSLRHNTGNQQETMHYDLTIQKRIPSGHPTEVYICSQNRQGNHS
jgi:hypothetical protein